MTLIPVFVSLGRIPPSGAASQIPERPNAFGMDGPVTSASMMPTERPRRRSSTAASSVTSDLPTPPLPLTTPITFPTMLIALIGSNIDSFFELHAAPQVEQSWVQPSISFSSSIMIFSCPPAQAGLCFIPGSPAFIFIYTTI